MSSNQSKTMSHSHKVIVIGDMFVGKTSLVRRFRGDKSKDYVVPTIGVDLRAREVHVGEKTIRIWFWDTAGQERFHCLPSTYFRNVDAVLFVYDLTDKVSFDNLQFWLNDTKEHLGEGEFNDVPKILIGNKCDCTDRIAVTKQMGEKFAKTYNMLFYETSTTDEREAKYIELILNFLALKLQNFSPKSFSKFEVADLYSEPEEKGCC